jgi:hypothetical protein
MPHSLLRDLSPNEQTTLRLIAQGDGHTTALRADDVARLRNFGFVETSDGRAVLTPLGTERLAFMTRTMTS